MPDPSTNYILAKEKEKLQKIIAEVKEGVIIVDSQHKVSLMNKSAEEITGYGFVESLGQPIGNVLTVLDHEKEIPPSTYCPVQTVNVDGVVYEGKNLSLINKTDEIKIVHLKSQKMKDGEQMGVGCILTIDDAFNQNELERMKLDFVSMSVHVLRTPLSILKGYLSFLTREETLTKLDEKEMYYLKNSVTSTDDLIYLVENLLDLTEVQSENFKILPKPIDLDNTVASVVDELKPTAEVKHLNIVYAPSPREFPLVVADVIRIKIVLRNLIGNAIKFTNDGTVAVKVSKENQKFMKVVITDTGKGIPQKNIPHLFKKFYRVKEALEMETGQGLGLYVSKKIIESHGGDIGVESTEGAGSSFYFTLPVLQ